LDGPVYITEEWPEPQWWLDFNDPQLDALISQALLDNPSITIAEARFRAAFAFSNQANAYTLPSLDYEVDVTSIKNSQNGIFGILNKTDPTYPLKYFQKNMAIQLQYDFDFFKKRRNEFFAVLSEANALEIETYTARLNLAISVSQSYFKLQIFRMREILAKKLAENRNLVVELTQKRLGKGLERQSDVNQAINSKLNSVQNISQIIQEKNTSYYELQSLVANDFRTPVEDLILCEKLEPFPLPNSLPLNLIAHRPDIWAQRWRVEAAARRICVANADFYPNVNLNGAYGFQAIEPNPWFDRGSIYGVLFGPAVNLPIFKGGALIAARNKRVAEYTEAVAQYDLGVITAAKEVLIALSILKQTTIRYEIALQTENLAKENLEQVRLLKKQTLNSNLDVVISEIDLMLITDNKLVCLLDYYQARLSLIHALGGGYEMNNCDF
jgi:NodT family efflux transporter outer membrane factor (OMF) lipoprotein